jgi:hypothetical protein
MGSIKKWLANLVLDGLQEIEKDEDRDDECDCDDCRAEREKERGKIGYPAPPMSREEAEQAMMDNWEPPSRYCIRAAGVDYFVDDWKSSVGGYGLDVCWIQKIKGEERPVFATLFENSFTIIDYDSPMTVEAFEHVKKQSIDYVTQLASEHKANEDAKKKKEQNPPQDVSLAAYM